MARSPRPCYDGVMRIAAISDIHGNLAALEAVLADIRARGADVIVNLGDILSGPLEPAETADLLMALDLPTIRGNHERQLLTDDPATMGASDKHAMATLTPKHLAWIAGLPTAHWLMEGVFLCHGTPASDLIYFLEEVDHLGCHPAPPEKVKTRAGDCPARLIFCGHTHMPRAMTLPDGRLIVNPGSVGVQAYDWDVPLPHKMENGSPHARYAIVTMRGTDFDVEFHAVDYDWESAARTADARHRPDWAVALRTGRL